MGDLKKLLGGGESTVASTVEQAPVQQNQPQTDPIKDQVQTEPNHFVRKATETYMDSVVDTPVDILPEDMIHPIIKQMDDVTLEKTLSFFVNPGEQVDKVEKYRNDIDMFTKHRSMVFNEYFNRRAKAGLTKPEENVRDFWEYTNHMYKPQQEQFDFEQYQRQLLGDAEYERRIQNAQDDTWWTTFWSSAANAVTGVVPGSVGMFASGTNLIADDLTEADEKMMKWALDFGIKNKFSITDKASETWSGHWFAAGLGSALGSIFGTVAASTAGAVVGSAIAPGAGTIAGIGMGVGVGAAMGHNEVFNELYQKTGDLELSTNVGMAAAIPMGILERVGAGSVIEKPVAKMFSKKLADQLLDESLEKMMVGEAGDQVAKAWNREFASGTIEYSKRLIQSEYWDQMKKPMLINMAGGAAAEFATEFSQAAVADAAEVITAHVTDDNRLDQDFLTWDHVKSWAEEGFFGALAGGGMTAVTNSFSKPTGESTAYQVVDAVQKGDQEFIGKVKNMVQEKVGKKGHTQQQADMLIREIELVEKATKEHVGSITNRHAQRQIIAAAKLKQEVDDRIAASPESNTTGDKRAILDGLKAKIHSEIDFVMNQAKNEGKAKTFKINGDIDKSLTALEAAFRVKIDKGQDSNYGAMWGAAASPFINSFKKTLYSKDTKEYSEEQLSAVKEIEKETGAILPKNVNELKQTRDFTWLGRMFKDQQSLRAAKYISENTDQVFQAWKQNRLQDTPSPTLKFQDGERTHEVNHNDMNRLFSQFVNDKKVDSLPSLDYFVETQDKNMEIQRQNREGAVQKAMEIATGVAANKEMQAIGEDIRTAIANGSGELDPEKEARYVELYRKANPDKQMSDADIIDELTKDIEVVDQSVSEVKAKDKFSEMEAPTELDKAAQKAGFDDRAHVVNSLNKRRTEQSESQIDIKTDGQLDNKKVNQAFEQLTAEDIQQLGQLSESATNRRSNEAKTPKSKTDTEIKTESKSKTEGGEKEVLDEKPKRKPRAKAKKTVSRRKPKTIESKSRKSKATAKPVEQVQSLTQVETKSEKTGKVLDASSDPVETTEKPVAPKQNQYVADNELNSRINDVVNAMKRMGESQEDIDRVVSQLKAINEGTGEQSRVLPNNNGLTVDANEIALRDAIAAQYAEAFGIPADQVLMDEFGPGIMAMATDAGVLYAHNSDAQHVPHEYAHYYIRNLRRNYKKVWNGLKKRMEGTEFEHLIGQLYPEKTGDALTEEAMVTLIGRSHVENLASIFDKSTFGKLKAIFNTFWSAIKNVYKGHSEQAAADLAALHMALSAKAKSIPSSVIEEFKHHEFSKQEDLPFRKAAINRFNQAVLGGGQLFEDLDLSRARDKYFYANPSMYVFADMLREAHKKHSPFNFLQQVFGKNSFKQLQKDAEMAYQSSSDPLMQYALLQTKMLPAMEQWKAFSMAYDDGNYEFFNSVAQNTRGIPKHQPSFELVTEYDYQLSPTIKRVLTGMVDYDGKPIHPDLLKNYVYDIAMKTDTPTAFVKAVRELAKSGTEKGRVAGLFLDRIAGLKNRDGSNFRVDDVMRPLLNEFRSMYIAEHVAFDITDNGDIRQFSQNRSVNVDELVDEAVQAGLNHMENFGTNPEQAFSATIKWLKTLENALRQQYKSDEEVMTRLMNSYLNRVLLKSDINLDYNTLKHTLKEYSPNIENPYGYMYNLLALGNKSQKDYQKSKDYKRFFNEQRGLLRALMVASKDLDKLDSTYKDVNGNSQSALSVSTHAEREVMKLFEQSGRSQKSNLDVRLGSAFYANNEVLQLWKELGTTGMVKWRETVSSNGKGLGISDIGKPQMLAIELSNFVKRGKNYMHVSGLNGSRDYRYLFRAPKYVTKEARNENFKSIISDVVGRVNALAQNGKLKVDEQTLEKLNGIYPLKLKIVKNEFAYDRDATNLMIENDHAAHMDLLKHLGKRTLNQMIFNYKNSMKNVAGNPIDMNSKNEEVLEDMVKSFAYSNMVNEFRMRDFLLGEMATMKDAAKIIKRSMGPGSKGLVHTSAEEVVVVIPDTGVGTDSMGFINQDFENDLRNDSFGLQNNHKLHTYHVNENGERIYLKAAYASEMNGSLAHLDTPGSNDYSKISELMKRAKELTGKDKVRIRVVYESAAKSLDIPHRVLQEGEQMTRAHLATFTPQTLVTNFRMNKDYEKESQRKKLPVQLSRIISELGRHLPIEEREAHYAKFEELLIGVLQKQHDDYFSKKDRHNDQALAHDLQARTFGNDLLMAAGSKLEYLNEIFDGDLWKHIEDPNMFNTAIGHLTTMFSEHSLQPQMAGGVLQTIADPEHTLSWDKQGVQEDESLADESVVKTDDGRYTYKNPEVMVPSSMGLPGEKVVLVRVPASGPMSMFVGVVKANTPSDVNVVKVPEGFIKVSDADHDGDVLHAYRLPRKGDSEFSEDKQELWNFIVNTMEHPEFVKDRERGISLEDIQQLVKDDASNLKLNTHSDTLHANEQVTLGRKAIGNFANARKTLSLLAQYGIRLTKQNENGEIVGDPVTFYVDGQPKKLSYYSYDNMLNMAQYLQAALDNVSEMLLLPMGAREQVLGEFIVLTGLSSDIDGVLDQQEVFKFFNGRVAQTYANELSAMTGMFGHTDYVSGRERIALIDDMKKRSGFTDQNSQNALNTLRQLVIHADHIRDIMHILSMDDGIPYGIEKVQKIQDSFKKIDQNKDQTPYAKLFEKKKGNQGLPSLFGYYRIIVDQYMQTVANMTVTFQNDVQQMQTHTLNEMGVTNPYITHRKEAANIVRNMLDQSVMANSYASQDEFIKTFGNALIGLKYGSEEWTRIGSAKKDVELTNENQREFILEQIEEYEIGESELSEQEVNELRKMLAEDLVSEQASEDLAQNAFIKNLIIKDENGKVTIRFKNAVDKMAENEADRMMEDFQKLGPEFGNMLRDYVTLVQGNEIRNGSLWSVIGYERQMERYQLAANIKEDGRLTPADRKALQENMVFNMKHRIRQIETNVVYQVPHVEMSRVEQMVHLSSLFPKSANEMAAESGGMYKVNVSGKQLLHRGAEVGTAREWDLPPIIRVTDHGDAMTPERVMVFMKKEGENFEQGITSAFYLDITDAYAAREGKYKTFGKPKPELDTETVQANLQERFRQQYNEKLDDAERMLGNQTQQSQPQVQAARAIATNQKQYTRIVNKLKKLYPHINVMTWKEYNERWWVDSDVVGQARISKMNDGSPAEALARIVAWSNDATLDTIPHEYAHHYVDMFRNDPIIQAAMEVYGDEEALIQDIGEAFVKQMGKNELGRLMRKAMFNVQKFVQKKVATGGFGELFWNYMQQVFGHPSIAEELAMSMMDGTVLKNGQESLNETSWNQYRPERGQDRITTLRNNYMDGERFNSTEQQLEDYNYAETRELTNYNAYDQVMGNDVLDMIRRDYNVFRENMNDPRLPIALIPDFGRTGSNTGNFFEDIVDQNGNIHYPGSFLRTFPQHIKVGLSRYLDNIEERADRTFRSDVPYSRDQRTNNGMDSIYLTQGLMDQLKDIVLHPTVNVNGIDVNSDQAAMASFALLMNPADPLSIDTIGFNVDPYTRLYAERFADQVMRIEGMLKRQETANNYLVEGGGVGLAIQDVLGEIHDSLLSNSNVLQSLHSSEHSLKNTMGGWILDKILTDKFGDLSSKIYQITGTDKHPLYEVFVGAFQKAARKSAEVLYGTRSEPGAVLRLAEGYGRIEGLEKYRYGGGKQFSLNPMDWVRDGVTGRDNRFTNDLAENFTVHDESGVEWKLSLGEMVNIAVLASHVDPRTGTDMRQVMLRDGVLLNTARGKFDKRTDSLLALTNAEISRIESVVGAFQNGVIGNEVIPAMRNMLNYTHGFVNETYYGLTGKDFDYYPNYWPMFYGRIAEKERVERSIENDTVGQFRHVIEATGIIGTGQTIQIQDMFDMMDMYARGAAEFHGYAVASRNVGKLRSNKLVLQDGREVSLKQMFVEQGLEKTYNDIMEHVDMVLHPDKRIQTNKQLHVDEDGRVKMEKSLRKEVHKNFTRAALAFKAGVALVQMHSSMLAADMIPMHRVMWQWMNAPRNILRLYRSMNYNNIVQGSLFDPSTSRDSSFREMTEHSAYLHQRFLGGALDPSQMNTYGVDTLSTVGKKGDSWLGLVDINTMFGMIRMGDMFAISQIWEAVKKDTEINHPNLQRGSYEYWDHVKNYTEEIVQRTQPTSEAIGRNKAQMDPGSWISYFYMFGSQRVKMAGSMVSSYYQWRHNPNIGNTAGVVRNMANKFIFGAGMYSLTSLAYKFGKESILKGWHDWYDRDEFENDEEAMATLLAYNSMQAFVTLVPFLGQLASGWLDYEKDIALHGDDGQAVFKAMMRSTQIADTAPERAIKEGLYAAGSLYSGEETKAGAQIAKAFMYGTGGPLEAVDAYKQMFIDEREFANFKPSELDKSDLETFDIQ